MVICLARSFLTGALMSLLRFPTSSSCRRRLLTARAWTLIDQGQTPLAFQVLDGGLHFLEIVTYDLDLLVEPEAMAVNLLWGDTSTL